MSDGGLADHIVFPVESLSPYPYTVDDKHPSEGDALETFSILGVVSEAAARGNGGPFTYPRICRSWVD